MSQTTTQADSGQDSIKTSDFPHGGTSEEQLKFLLNYAILAPSSHNTQPWLWEVNGNEVTLFADRSRVMSALDPNGRELIMSCGAALQHLRLAIRAFGYADIVSLFPNPRQPDLLAYVRLAAPHAACPEDEFLFNFIGERHTNRRLFQQKTVPDALLLALQEEAEREGAWLYIAPGPDERAAITELIAAGDVIQGDNRAIRRDVAGWVAPAHSARLDGIPSEALGIHDVVSHVAPFAMRWLNNGEKQADKDLELAESAPAIVVLGTDDEGPAAWLDAGQALARILLRARAAEVWASFFSQPIQVDTLWTQLRHVIGRSGVPQLVFRLGYAEPVPATPRRPPGDVTM